MKDAPDLENLALSLFVWTQGEGFGSGRPILAEKQARCLLEREVEAIGELWQTDDSRERPASILHNKH